jgi:hypothetical protein
MAAIVAIRLTRSPFDRVRLSGRRESPDNEPLITFGMINFKRDRRREPTHAAHLAGRKNGDALPAVGARRRRLKLPLFVQDRAYFARPSRQAWMSLS